MSDRNVLLDAGAGGVVTLLTSFVPLSPVVGGLVSGYLAGRTAFASARSPGWSRRSR